MLPKKLIIIVTLCLLQNLGISQDVTPVGCGTFSVDLTQQIQPEIDLDPEHPFNSKVQWYSFTASTSFCEISTSPLNFDLFNFDAKLYLFEDKSPSILPLYFDDNGNNVHIGHSFIQAQLELGQDYLIAVAASNNEEGQCQLTIAGNCHEISDFSEVRNEEFLKCDDTENIDFDLSVFGVGGDSHISYNSHVYDHSFSNCIKFRGNGEEMTIQMNGIDLPSQINFRYDIVKPNSNSFELLQSENFATINPSSITINVTETSFDQSYFLIFEMMPLLFEQASLFDDAGVDMTLSSTSSCSPGGTFNSPVVLIDGYSTSGGVKDWSTNAYSDNYCIPLEGSSHFAKTYSFEGDGLNHTVEWLGGVIYNDCGSCPISDNARVSILRWNFDEYVCEANLEISRTLLTKYTFESVANESYLIVIEMPRYITVFGDIVGNYSFEMIFDEERALAHQTLFANAITLECGTSIATQSLAETDLNQNSLITECGSIGFGENTSVFTIEGTGDNIDFQTIARDGVNGTLNNFISVFREESNGYSCIEYRHLGNSNGFTSVDFNSTFGAIYQIVVESISDENNSFEAEAFNFNCTVCFAEFGEEGFPNGTSSQSFIEETVEEYPECCLLGWTSNCEAYIEQLIYSEISEIAQPISCGVHSIDLSNVSHTNFEGLTFNDLKFNEKAVAFEFFGTGSPMDFLVTINGFQSYSDVSAFIISNNGTEWEILQEANNGFSEYNSILNNFSNVAGEEYYLLVQTNGFLNENPSFELTITDDTNCGICDVVFNNEVPFNNDDGVFQAVLNTSPGCCSDWTQGCQSLYELFYFPNCSAMPELFCNDNIAGSTIDSPIYSGHFCGETIFDSGSSWYTFTGNGETMIAEVLDPQEGPSFSTMIHGFRGECPFLECLISDNNGGADGRGLIEIPTVEGEQYFIAVTGENAEEGDFKIRLYSSDYCNTCFTAFENQHQYEVSNPIYQQVIQDMPSCCNGEWSNDCQLAYDLIICGNSDEPNDDSGNATALSSFFNFYEADSHNAALLAENDEDHYTFSVSNQGELFINLFSSLTSIDLNMSLFVNGVLVDEAVTIDQSFEFLSLNIESDFLQQLEIVVWSAEGGDFSENECYELFWDWIPAEIPSCLIDVALEDVSFCDPQTNTHEVEIEITALNVGGATWVINGSEYSINNEIEVLVIDNLLSDGIQHNLQISVKENPECAVVLENFYTAPEPCLEIGSDCVMDGNADGEIGAADLLFFLSVFGTECD